MSGTARWVWVLLAFLGAPAAAGAQPQQLTSAQEEEARGLFEAGRAAFAAGRYESALEYFEGAHELTQLPELLYNIGQSADRMRNDERALEAFRAYLEARPDSEDRASVQARIAALERTIGERRADADARERAEAEVRRAHEGDAAAAEPAAQPSPSPRAPSPAGWIVAGSAGALIVAGVVLLAVADARAAEVRAAQEGTPWLDVASAYAEAESFSVGGGVLLGIGAAALAAGLVWGAIELWASGEAEVAIGPSRLELRGRF